MISVASVRFRGRRAGQILVACVGLYATPAVDAQVPSRPPLHYTANHNFNHAGAYIPFKAGFNLADVNDPDQLRALPSGVKGLVWVGQCAGADARFIATITPYIGERDVFGFYLMDDPDPRTGPARCKPDDLAAESDWIHAHAPGTKTFIVAMNLAPASKPSFQGTYNPANSHIDLYGIDPYPCRSELGACDYAMIDNYVRAGEAGGIPRTRMIPVYQSFGDGDWSDGDGGKYVLPTPTQLRDILMRWRTLIASPVFDYAYSWGSQKDDRALEASAELQAIFSDHNRGR
jgi:hypothetical protein